MPYKPRKAFETAVQFEWNGCLSINFELKMKKNCMTKRKMI